MRVGWRILRNALASICRIRSRVTLNWRPTSSSTTVAIHEAKALFEHLTFAFGERVQHVLDLILE